MSRELTRLKKWYAGVCNGVWEHSHGIKIETLDNPGWKLSIDLKDTKYEEMHWPETKINNGDEDWLTYRVREGKFEAFGDVSKIETMLSIFLSRVENG